MITKMEVAKRLQDFGIRPSLHRTAVLEFLHDNRIHPTVEMIYDSLSPEIPTLSKTTIYNILSLFVERGVVQSITIDPRQCRYDGDTSEHAHFMCTECGKLYDIFVAPVSVDCEHSVTHAQLYLKGICKHCSN